MAYMPNAGESVNPSDETAEASPLFVCEVLDADENSLGLPVETGDPRKTWPRFGHILYVRLVSGTLPSPVSRVDGGVARFEPGAFAPTPARLSATTGHIYNMTLLGSFSPLSAMLPSLRALFHPTRNAGPDARPVILEGGPGPFDAFRPRNAQLIAYARPEKPVRRTHRKRRERLQRALDRNERYEQLRQFEVEKQIRRIKVARLIQERGPDAAIEPLLEALNDELEDVRQVAAYELGKVANRLPLAPFLSAIRENTSLNVQICHAAAFVFLAHVDEVPVEALLDLYHGAYGLSSPNIHATAIEAMGRLGERVTDEIVALLVGIVTERRVMYDLRVRWSAARALESLGPRAPVDALIAALHSDTDGVPPPAARALLRHPAHISAEILEEARLLSDPETARHIHYLRIREGLNQRGE